MDSIEKFDILLRWLLNNRASVKIGNTKPLKFQEIVQHRLRIS